MIKLTDGTRTVTVEMMVWQGSGYSPDFSSDFFDVGILPSHEGEDNVLVYHVDDVGYCIEQAQEWADEDENNTLFLDDVECE